VSPAPEPSGFPLNGVVYLVQPAGRVVANLEDLLARIAAADPETVFLHTQMPRLAPHADEDLPVDDLSGWVRGVVQDVATAERIRFAIYAANDEIEDVRRAIVRVLESTPGRASHAAPPGGELALLRFDVVEVATGEAATTPAELMEQLARADRIVWFHHLIEEAWMLPGPTPIAEWLRARGARRLAESFEREAAGGRSVERMRARILQRWRRAGLASRLAERGADEAERASVSREAASRLARRLAGGDPP